MAVRVGLSDLHYAILMEDKKVGNVVTNQYGTPKPIVGAVSASINPNSSKSTFFADDGPMDTVAALGEIEVSLSMSELTPTVIAEILGHEIDEATKTIVKKSTDTAPWLALGFKSLKSNGKYKYIWLAKGRFTDSEESFETKSDSPNFQADSITGAFVKRESDDIWQYVLDEDVEGFVQGVADNWFNQVEPTPAA